MHRDRDLEGTLAGARAVRKHLLHRVNWVEAAMAKAAVAVRRNRRMNPHRAVQSRRLVSRLQAGAGPKSGMVAARQRMSGVEAALEPVPVYAPSPAIQHFRLSQSGYPVGVAAEMPNNPGQVAVELRIPGRTRPCLTLVSLEAEFAGRPLVRLPRRAVLLEAAAAWAAVAAEAGVDRQEIAEVDDP